jgi:DNA-binding FadR family transcriptional regulator
MNSAERKQIQTMIKRARSQRNATTNNEDFDYWQGILEQCENKLQTGENK